jgi:hypothetical protein
VAGSINPGELMRNLKKYAIRHDESFSKQVITHHEVGPFSAG